jgi:hypothetical protein
VKVILALTSILMVSYPARAEHYSMAKWKLESAILYGSYEKQKTTEQRVEFIERWYLESFKKSPIPSIVPRIYLTVIRALSNSSELRELLRPENRSLYTEYQKARTLQQQIRIEEDLQQLQESVARIIQRLQIQGVNVKVTSHKSYDKRRGKAIHFLDSSQSGVGDIDEQAVVSIQLSNLLYSRLLFKTSARHLGEHKEFIYFNWSISQPNILSTSVKEVFEVADQFSFRINLQPQPLFDSWHLERNIDVYEKTISQRFAFDQDLIKKILDISVSQEKQIGNTIGEFL